MNRKQIARVMGQTALIALMTAPAMAQDAVDLDEITIQTDDGIGPVDGANPATLAGSKTATAITEIPQSVSVIGADDLQNANARKVDEALAYSAGVQAAPYGYDSDTNWFFIRGFAGTATGAFVDGLQNYSYGFGGFYIDPYQLERVEVLRGASSALYGGSNPGGLVNMVTKRPTSETRQSQEIGLDTNGGWAAIDYQGSTNDYDWRLVAKGAQTGGNGSFEDGYRGFIAPSLSFATAGGTDVTLSASYTAINEDHVGGAWLPYTGSVVAADFGYIDRDFNSGEPAYDWYDREQFTASAEFVHDLANGLTLTNATRYGYAHLTEGSVYAYGYSGYAATPQDADNNLSRIIFDHDTTTQTLVNDTRVETVFNTGAVEHSAMAGLDLKWFEMDQVQSSAAWPDAATLLSATDPVYGADQPGTAPYADNVVTQTQVGLYAQDQMRWGDGWIATANLRHDWVETDVSDDRTSGAAGSSRIDSAWSGRLGIARELANGLTPYASASTYFNPQIETSSAGNTITPETGEQYEIGAKWASVDGRSFVGLSAFQIARRGIVQNQWTGAGYAYYQLGEVTSKGIEFEAKHAFDNGVAVQLALTDMDVDVTADIDSSIIGNTPYATIEQMAAVQVSWTPAMFDALTVTGGVRWNGASWADNANTMQVPDVTLYDVSAAYEINDAWAANLSVTNLADTKYVAACDGSLSCFYGDGRNVSLALRSEF